LFGSIDKRTAIVKRHLARVVLCYANGLDVSRVTFPWVKPPGGRSACGFNSLDKKCIFIVSSGKKEDANFYNYTVAQKKDTS